MRVNHLAGERVITGFCRYLDDMIRCDDLRWRFSQRICEIESLR